MYGFSSGRWLRPLGQCVLRKPDTATAEARLKMRRKASFNGRQAQESALHAAAYGMFLTPPPEEEFSAASVLEPYRCRWQIERAFQRLKSLLRAGHVPKAATPWPKPGCRQKSSRRC